jgi:hypothetical protein
LNSLPTSENRQPFCGRSAESTDCLKRSAFRSELHNDFPIAPANWTNENRPKANLEGTAMLLVEGKSTARKKGWTNWFILLEPRFTTGQAAPLLAVPATQSVAHWQAVVITGGRRITKQSIAIRQAQSVNHLPKQ